MNEVVLNSFEDELAKIAGLSDVWNRFLDLFRSSEKRTDRQVAYHFSDRAGDDRWDKFYRNVSAQTFVDTLAKHPLSDDKLVRHAQALHDLMKSSVVTKVPSMTGVGLSYEIRRMPDGRLACTCNDWRFKGSINPDYDCRHVRAYKQSEMPQAKAA